MIQRMKNQWADKLGIISAILCMLHCLALPSLMIMGFGFLGNPMVTASFVGISFISIYAISKKKSSQRLITFLWIVYIGLVISIVLEEKSNLFEYASYLFSLAIIVGHLLHMRYSESIC